MGKWMGEMGGLVAVALIVTLAARFLHEMGVWKDEALLRARGKTALRCALAGIGYLTLGGFCHKFFRGDCSPWDIGAVWGLNDLEMYLCFLATIGGALLLEAVAEGAYQVVVLPFAFYLYVRPGAALGFCAACALVCLLLRGRALPPLRRMAPWVQGALCVLDGFVLLACCL